jgi:predicted 3-demethylubiquinone-9 3-methyltransferase (glyoxalase superfamily)
MPTVTPHLWFEKDVEAAAEFYTSVFPDSGIHAVRRYENTGPNGDQTVTTVELEVAGQRAILLEAGPEFTLNEAFSFFVECEDQAEVDEYWGKLTADGGQEGPCGWLKDRYGVSWQIVPRLLDELLQDEDRERANAVMQAMLRMGKIDCAALQRAYDEPVQVA